MNIIIGHSNMDCDCVASVLLARYLYPDYISVMSRLIHPAAKNLYNLYQYHMNFIPPQDLKGEQIENIVIVDTRSLSRLKEYFEFIPSYSGVVEIYDHHPDDSMDIPGAIVHGRGCGATVTILSLEIIRRGISISPDDATIALTGLYSDTGNFCHEYVTSEDFQVASWLISQGGQIKLVKSFLKSLKVDYQLTLLHDLLNHLEYRDYNGHRVLLTYMELEKQVSGLAAVVEKAFDIEGSDAIFSVFHFQKENDTVIIARSSKETIDVNRILQSFGGGGHPMASSALIKKTEGDKILDLIERYLGGMLAPALTAEDIMSQKLENIHEDWTLMDASVFLERINHTGAPVVDDNGRLSGILTLRDIMKGRKAGQMHVPVRAFMRRNIITVTRSTLIREIESLMYEKNIGHLPVVENNEVIGIITRSDYLTYLGNGESEQDNHSART